jgi:AbrB family looped-hinge helix DNA binding protein
VGGLAEVIVDEKNRLTLPKDLRKKLGIESGSKLQLEQVGAQIIIKPAVPIKEPTESIWGLAGRGFGRSPKKQAREAIAKRKKLGK